MAFSPQRKRFKTIQDRHNYFFIISQSKNLQQISDDLSRLPKSCYAEIYNLRLLIYASNFVSGPLLV